MEFRRFDSVKIEDSRLDDSGFLRVSGVIGRVGVQIYIDKDGKQVRELRLPEEVEVSAKSFSRQPITLNHPGDFVNSQNSQQLTKGFSGEVEFEDGVLDAENIVITSIDAILAAQTTHKQLSCGYYCDLEESKGVWVDEYGVQGEIGKSYEYDCIQRNIRGNHIALVPLARAGSIASLKLDAVARCDGETEIIIPKPIVEAMEIKFDGKSYKSETEVLALLDSLTEQNTKLTNSNSALEAKIDALKIQVEQASKQKLDSEAIAAEVEARLEVWGLVAHRLDSEPDYSLPVLEVQREYLAKACPNLASKLAKADASYIGALWDAFKPEVQAATQETPAQKAKDSIKETLEVASVKEDAAESARNAYIARISSAYKA